MIVMPSNNAGIYVGWLAGRFPGRIQWLIGVGDWKRPPNFMPYALDNGAFAAWTQNKPWDEGAFWALLDQASHYARPQWIVVPDVVANREATMKNWDVWAPAIRERHTYMPLAFAVQDGMTPADIPKDADVVFVGGTTDWKWRTLEMWTKAHPRVHVGRVNSERLLWMAHRSGAESCDGTGWLRGNQDQLEGLLRYLEHSSHPMGHPQAMMELN